MSESIVGKYYLPHDNSYSVNLTSASNYPYDNEQLYLAGTNDTDAKLCKIVSEPFICNVRVGLDGDIKQYEMILVEYEGQTSSILYHKDSVFDEILSNGIPLEWEDAV